MFESHERKRLYADWGAKGKVYCLELSKKQKAVVQCVSFEEKVSSQADKENVSHGPINSIYAFSDGGEIFVATGCVRVLYE